MAGPIEQFKITPIIRIEIGGLDLSFTNSSVYMLLVVFLLAAFFLSATLKRRLVPGRLQCAAELLFEFIADTLRTNAGRDGMRFFAFVFSLFMFILVANLVGMLPYSFTVTSHLIITLALAMVVFATVTLYGIARHGFGFLRLFLPPGVPIFLAPLIIPIEIASYIARPISHAVRLFAVMLAGHIALKVFANFVVSLIDFGGIGFVGAVLPLLMTVAITALEILMCVVQAYIFAMLTCIYLKDALHPGH